MPTGMSRAGLESGRLRLLAIADQLKSADAKDDADAARRMGITPQVLSKARAGTRLGVGTIDAVRRKLRLSADYFFAGGAPNIPYHEYLLDRRQRAPAEPAQEQAHHVIEEYFLTDEGQRVSLYEQALLRSIKFGPIEPTTECVRAILDAVRACERPQTQVRHRGASR